MVSYMYMYLHKQQTINGLPLRKINKDYPKLTLMFKRSSAMPVLLTIAAISELFLDSQNFLLMPDRERLKLLGMQGLHGSQFMMVLH